MYVITFWVTIGFMWCIALFAMYNQGCIDTLNWSKRLVQGDLDAKHRASWKDITFYVAPLVVFTAVGLFFI